MPEPVDIFRNLDRKRVARGRELKPFEEYLKMDQPLKYMAPALEEEFGGRLTQLIVDLPSVIVEAYESVMDVKGFTLSGRPTATSEGARGAQQQKADGDRRAQELWEIWKANQMPEQMPLLHTDSIGLGCAYMISGPGESRDDAPVMSVESPFQVYGERDPRSRKMARAIKRWEEDDGTGKVVQWGNLYERGVRRTFYKQGRTWTEDEGLKDEHGQPTTRVVAFPNRPRILHMGGVSEFAGILPSLDGINKMATDMMVSGEFHAMPRRYAFGLKKEDFQDEHGNQLSTWQQLAGGVWASEVKGNDVTVGQFAEADLTVFHNSIKLLLQLVFMQVALPSYISAFQGDNPASADAIRATESQKVKRSERKQVISGGSLEDVQRNNWMIMGRDVKELDNLETSWRNPATPTKAQEADASVKLVQAKVIPPQQARKDLDYSPEERSEMETWDRQNALDPFYARHNEETGGQEGI